MPSILSGYTSTGSYTKTRVQVNYTNGSTTATAILLYTRTNTYSGSTSATAGTFTFGGKSVTINKAFYGQKTDAEVCRVDFPISLAGGTYSGTSSNAAYIGGGPWSVSIPASTFTVSYNANGGSGSISSHTATYGKTFTVKDNSFTRTGYSFAGWTSKSNGTNDGYGWFNSSTLKGWSGTWSYTNGQYGVSGDALKLYAMWKINSYTLTVNPNGGTWSGSTSSQTFTQNYNTTKTIANPTRTGYTFAGWSKSGTGTLSGTTWTYGAGNGTLTATWTANSYTATFDANGGTTASPSTITKTYGTALGTLPTTTRTNYKFLGWFTAASGGTQISSSTTMGASNVTYYAHWELDLITISYDGNGVIVQNVPGSQQINPGTFTISSEIPNRERYNFFGWSTQPGVLENIYQPGDTINATNGMSLYAIWLLEDKQIYAHPGGVLNAVEFYKVSEVDKLFDRNGCIYATEFITHDEPCIYFCRNGKIYAKEFKKS